MPDIARDIHGVMTLVCGADAPPLLGERDANAFISEAWSQNATLVAIPVERIIPDFFELKTRLAGEVIQKFVNHHLRLAIVGDISAKVAESKSLHDFVFEANRGRTVWFVRDLDELEKRLAD